MMREKKKDSDEQTNSSKSPGEFYSYTTRKNSSKDIQ